MSNAAKTSLGGAIAVGFLLYAGWCCVTGSHLAAWVTQLQLDANGSARWGLTWLVTLVSLASLALVLPAFAALALRLLRPGERPPRDALGELSRFRRRAIPMLLLVFVGSGAFVLASVSAPDALHSTLGGWTKALLFTIPLGPLALVALLELSAPTQYIDGRFDGRQEVHPPMGDGPPIFRVIVGDLEVNVSRTHYDAIAVGDRVGLVTTGGLLAIHVQTVDPTESTSPYR